MLKKTAPTRSSGIATPLALILIAVVPIVVVALVLIPFYISGYNKAVRFEKAAEEAWANVDVQLQRRLDLIPNLVESVRGYASHERELFESIAAARTKYFQTESVAGKIEASNGLSGLLSRLLVLRETYPDLKANQNFLALQDQLEGTENRIAVARTRYNAAVTRLNTYAREFAGSFFAKRAGVESMPLFEATAQAQEEVPAVDFSTRAPEPAAK